MLLMDHNRQIAMGIMEKGVAMHYITFAVFISFVNAALEEIYWRWFVFGQLFHLVSRWWAHGIAAIAFASFHFVILGQLFPTGATVFFGLVVGGVGLVWSLIYEKYGSLLGPWLSHMIIDAGLMWIGWLALQDVGS